MSEERYIEWLERLEIPIDAMADIETFQDYLRDELNFNYLQVSALTDMYAFERDSLLPYGVSAVKIEYPWGEETRFSIKGYRGLFGWERTKEIAEEEGWW